MDRIATGVVTGSSPMLKYLGNKLGMSKFKIGAIISLIGVGLASGIGSILGVQYGFLTPVEQIVSPLSSIAYFLIALGYVFLPDSQHAKMSTAFKLVCGATLMIAQIEASLSEVNNIEFYIMWLPAFYIALLFAYLKERKFNWGYNFFYLSGVSVSLCLIFGPLPLSSRAAVMMIFVIICQGILVVILSNLERFLKHAGANEARTKILQESTKQLRRAAEESEAARKEATAANRAKSRFIANMSHELRTPLNSIIGFSEILKQTDGFGNTKEQQSEYIEHIHESGNHLLSLVNDILDVAKIEAGKMTLRETEVWLEEIVDSAAVTVEALALHKNITLKTDAVDASLTLYADPKMLKQVMLNLLSNSVKFTEDGGLVEVKTSVTSSGDIELTVSDNGIGMDEEAIKNVMEPFVQAEDEYAREQGGTGLGLYLVHAMMKLHEGDARIYSKPGEGTKVTLVFPAERNVSQKLSA